MSKKQPTAVLTSKVRILFPYVFTPYEDKENNTSKYKCCILIPKKNKKLVNMVKDALDEAIEKGKVDKWGNKIPKKMHNPLRDGDTDESVDKYAEYYEGHYFINMSSLQKPGVVDEDLEAIIDKEEIYSGIWGRVHFNFSPFDNNSKGVAAYLNHIQKLDDGERIGGTGISVEEAFSDDEEDEEPRSKKKARYSDDDEDEDEQPRRKKKARYSDDDEDEDEQPRRKKKARDDDDEEDEQPRRKKKARDDDDEEDESPRRKKKARDDDDEEDESPRKKKKSRYSDDDEDEDEQPRRKKKARDDDEDEDESPRKKKKSRYSDDDEDEQPRRKKKARDYNDDLPY